jgi:hypothetical protein
MLYVILNEEDGSEQVLDTESLWIESQDPPEEPTGNSDRQAINLLVQQLPFHAEEGRLITGRAFGELSQQVLGDPTRSFRYIPYGPLNRRVVL